MYGPYIEVPEGRYSVCWRVELIGQPGLLKRGRALLRLDVTSEGGKTLLKERNIRASDFKEAGGALRSDFDLPKHGAQKVEFRIDSYWHGDFKLDMHREVRENPGKLVFKIRTCFKKNFFNLFSFSSVVYIFYDYQLIF